MGSIAVVTAILIARPVPNVEMRRGPTKDIDLLIVWFYNQVRLATEE